MRKRLHRHSITQPEFDSMLAAQGGACKICGQALESSGRTGLHIDHDHKTDKIRGLLCSSCNVGLGFFRDDPERLIAAINYLSE